MKSSIRFRWLLFATIALLTVAGAGLLRGLLLESTQQRLVRSYQQQLISLPERDAARLVQRLAESEAQWLEILVWASADERPLVSHTAERELQDLVDQWSRLPPPESSIRAARLARLLAMHAESIPPERRHLTHSLAQRLILWPVDGRRVDTAKFIADCQSVLLLPRAEQEEIRVAAAPEIREAAPAQAAPEQQPIPEIASPSPIRETPPQTVESSPAQPRPFIASPALRISDQ